MEQSIKSNQIPTAEEFLNKNAVKQGTEFGGGIYYNEVTPEMLIEFTNLHVQEALNAADGEVPLPYSHGVLNCYPLSNIK